MTLHSIKVWPEYYKAIKDGIKQFEARKNDRGFAVDDILWLREWQPASKYTGRELLAFVTFVLYGPAFGIEEGYCVMSLSWITVKPSNKTIEEHIDTIVKQNAVD